MSQAIGGPAPQPHRMMMAMSVSPGGAPPSLPAHWLRGPATLVLWLLFQPSRFRAYLQRVAPDLPPAFHLAELRRAQLRDPELRRLLIYGLFLCPTLFTVLQIPYFYYLNMVVHGSPARFATANLPAIWTGQLQVLCAASAFISFGGAVGALVPGFLGSAVLQIAAAAWSPEGGVIQGQAGGWQGVPVLVYQLCLAYALRARLAAADAPASPRRLLGGALTGLLLAAPLVLLCAAVSGRALGIPLGILGGGLALGLLLRGAGPKGALPSLRKALLRGVLAVAAFAALSFAGSYLAYRYNERYEHGRALAETTALITGLLPCFLLFLPALLGEALGGPIAGAVAGCLGGAFGWVLVTQRANPGAPPGYLLVGLGAAAAGLLWPLLRVPLLYPAELLLGQLLLRLQPARPRSLLPLHPALWDEDQRLPLVGLDDHLLLLLERSPPAPEPDEAVDLDASEPLRAVAATAQAWAAQEARLELDLRAFEGARDIEAIAAAGAARADRELAELEEALTAVSPGRGDLVAAAAGRSLARVGADLGAALRLGPYLRRLTLRSLEERLDGVCRTLPGADGRSRRYREVATGWRRLLAAHRRGLEQEAAESGAIANPFIVGQPLDARQQIFVGRADVAAALERLLAAQAQPPLLLYGQRRMGKTSLLRNLGRLLPSHICPLFVDLQGPVTCASQHAGLVYNLCKAIALSARRERGVLLTPPERGALFADPFTVLFDWLDELLAALARGAQGPAAQVLLMLDEFEALEEALRAGRFDRAQVLGALRHLMQHRAEIRVLLSGSHTLDEVSEWAGYLINAQVLHLGPLSEEAALQLCARPVPDFALHYDEDALAHLLALTGRHPFLVQLLCDRLVTLKNEEPPPGRYRACQADIERAAAAATSPRSPGVLFFEDIDRNQLDRAGREALRALARRGPRAVHGAEDAAPALRQALQQRELIDERGAFQNELIRRWMEGSAGSKHEDQAP